MSSLTYRNHRRLPRPAAILFSASMLALSGCAISGSAPASIHTDSASLHGRVMGGQQPVSGSTIQLWAAGSAGNGSASTSTALLTPPVTTDSGGSFNINGLYTCPTSSTQVYITAIGGNPGLSGNAVNPALSLVTALGDCGNLSSSTNVSINEVTTIAAAVALSPFASSTANIGASSSNLAGLRQAMITAMTLADSATGISPAASLPGNASVESAKLYTLANLLSVCVNSDGTGICPSLFTDATPTSGIAPTDVFTMALSIAANPANNVSQLFGDIPAQVPFGGGLNQTPSDWTVSMAYTGGGLNSPTSLSVDPAGNLWVANVGGTLSEFTSGGSPVSVNGYTGTGLNDSVALSIDSNSNVWVANMASTVNSGLGTVSLLSNAGSPLSGSDGLTAGNLNFPSAIASDSNGTTWVANSGGGTVTPFDATGTPLSGSGYSGSGTLVAPSALAVDASHNVWVADRTSGTVTRLDVNGNILNSYGISSLPDSLAEDSAGTLWVGDNADSTLVSLGSGAVVHSLSGGGLNRPRSIIVDAGDHVFVTDNVLNSLSEFAGTNSTSAAGTALSPSTGLGVDALMHQPFASAADASGTLWVTSFGDSRLIAFPGLATPTKTPTITLPQQP